MKRVEIPQRHVSAKEWAAIVAHITKAPRLGYGAFATVFPHPSKPHRVIKVEESAKGRRTAYHAFLEYALAYQDNPHMPRVYSAVHYVIAGGGEYEHCALVVEMERLSQSYKKVDNGWDEFNVPLSPRMKPLQSYAQGAFGGYYWGKKPAPRSRAWMQAKAIMEELDSLGYAEDLHDGNIMLRGNVPVITDPVCG